MENEMELFGCDSCGSKQEKEAGTCCESDRQKLCSCGSEKNEMSCGCGK